MKRRGTTDATATMRPIQKVQRQPRVGEAKPETMGEKRGPVLVALDS
jgi:hypothetical protein